MASRRALAATLVVTAAFVGIPGARAAAGPLPRLAVSLPATVAPADVARALQACGAQDALIVLPPVSATVGGADVVVASDSPKDGLPTGTRIYVRLVITISNPSVTGRDRELLLDRQVGDLVGGLTLTRPGISGLVIEPVSADASVEVLQFVLATVATKARGAHPGLEIALMAGKELSASGRLLAYVDSVVATVGQPTAPSQGKPLVLRTESPSQSAAGWLDALMTPSALGADTLWVQVEDLASLRRLCTSVQFLSRSLAEGFEMTAAERVPLAVAVDGRPPVASVAFVGSRSADTAVLLRADGSRQAPKPLTLVAAAAKTPQVSCFDAADGRPLEVRTSGQAPLCRGDTEYVLFHARTAASGDRMFESVNVTGRAGLRVEEIIARWQAAREAERQLLDNYSVPCFLSLHFEIASLTTSFDVALELRQFVDRTGVQDWAQTAFRVNGVKLHKGQEFPLPQIEPDKIVTKPLELRMDEKYAYELLGTETVRGHVCFVVGIKPAVPGADLYSGKIWIDGVDFKQVRLQLEQRDGKNNVASHVETQEYEGVKDSQGHAFTLVRSIYAEDSVNLAGRSITVEKRYLFGDYTINAADFAARLASERASDDPMFRNTEEGLRALRKKGDERVVEPMSGKRVFAMLGGLYYDGSYSFPVPLAGVSWVDFDWRKTGTQLSAFFAGPIFVANLSRQVNKNFRWGVDVSFIALPNTFYQYADNTEIKPREVRNFEQFVGGLLNWQVTPELDLSTQTDVFYEILSTHQQHGPELSRAGQRRDARCVRRGEVRSQELQRHRHGRRGSPPRLARVRVRGRPRPPAAHLDSLLARSQSARLRRETDAGRGLGWVLRRARSRPVLTVLSVVPDASDPARHPERGRLVRPGDDPQRVLRVQRLGLRETRGLLHARVDAEPVRRERPQAVRRPRLQHRRGGAIRDVCPGLDQLRHPRQPRAVQLALGDLSRLPQAAEEIAPGPTGPRSGCADRQDAGGLARGRGSGRAGTGPGLKSCVFRDGGMTTRRAWRSVRRCGAPLRRGPP